MILATLLDELFKNGVSLVATSTTSCRTACTADGLQRARFLPAIDLLKKHTEIVNVDSGIDYRLRALEQAELFHFPSMPRPNRAWSAASRACCRRTAGSLTTTR